MYVRLKSWHVVALTYRSGLVHTRCGRDVVVAGTIIPPEHAIDAVRHETSETVPGDERTCERCFVLSKRDEDAQTVPNDEVAG